MTDYAQHPPHDDEIDIGALLGLFWARKFTILLFAIVALLIGVAQALIVPPTYQADALVQLEEKSSGGLALSSEMADLLGGQAPVSVAEIEIIRSRMVLGIVVQNLGLDQIAEPKRLPIIGDFLTRYRLPDPGFSWMSEYAWNSERIAIGRLDLPERLQGRVFELTLVGQGSYTIDLDGHQISGKVGELLQDESSGFALLVDVLEGLPGRKFLIQKVPLANAISSIREQLSVSEKGRKSSILLLTMKDRNPTRAARILDEVTRVYLLQNIQRNTAEADSALQLILAQLPRAQADAEEAEAALNAFQADQETIDLSFETRALLEQAIGIETELNRLALEEQELRKRYTQSHPLYQTLLDNRAQLESRLQEIRTKTGALPEIQQEMLRLTQDLKVAQEVYLQLQSRAQELKVVKAGTIGNVRVIDTALPAPFPIAPKKKLIVALALILGLMAGTGFVLLRAFLYRGIRSAEEVENLGVSVYATVPQTANSVPIKGQNSIAIMAEADPTNLAVEALRSLRTSLHFGMLDANNKLCMVTSSIPGEGKSFVSVNLATVLAQSGQKICLVDTDLRRGYLHRYFGKHRKDAGLSDFLAGDVKIEEIIHKDEKTGLNYILTGRYPPNPAELLMHERFGELSAYLDANFDYSLFDTPPILAVTDPMIVGKYTGMIMLVVRHDHVVLDQVRASLKKFEVNGLKPTGVILNGDDPKTKGYGYTNYQYQYEYKSRGK